MQLEWELPTRTRGRVDYDHLDEHRSDDYGFGDHDDVFGDDHHERHDDVVHDHRLRRHDHVDYIKHSHYDDHLGSRADAAVCDRTTLDQRHRHGGARAHCLDRNLERIADQLRVSVEPL